MTPALRSGIIFHGNRPMMTVVAGLALIIAIIEVLVVENLVVVGLAEQRVRY